MPPTSNTIWFGAPRGPERLGVGGLGDPRELLQRARRHVGLEGAVERRPRAASPSPTAGTSRWRPSAARWPDAETRMPVRIGRVSSREAERATLPIVATNACGRHGDDGVAAGLGEGREVLAAQRADVEGRRAGDDLDVLLGGAQLERDGRRPAARGRRRASGGRGGRRCPRAAISAWSGTRRPTSMSVARSSTVPPSATTCTPESAWTAERVEATRETVCSCVEQLLRRSLELHDEYLSKGQKS